MGSQFKDHDVREIIKHLEKRIMGHYQGLARHMGQRYASSFFSASQKETNDTVCDVTIKEECKPVQYKEPGKACIKVCRRKSGKGNVHAFRVELKEDCSDIYGNNNPKFNVNYLAFAVENITGGWASEVHIYVLSKKKVLSVVKNLISMGAVTYKKRRKKKSDDYDDFDTAEKMTRTVNSKVKDEWGNFLNHTQMNTGVVLSNKFIKSCYMDKYGLGVGEDSNFKNEYRLEESLVSSILLEWDRNNIEDENVILDSNKIKDKLSSLSIIDDERYINTSHSDHVEVIEFCKDIMDSICSEQLEKFISAIKFIYTTDGKDSIYTEPEIDGIGGYNKILFVHFNTLDNIKNNKIRQCINNVLNMYNYTQPLESLPVIFAPPYVHISSCFTLNSLYDNHNITIVSVRPIKTFSGDVTIEYVVSPTSEKPEDIWDYKIKEDFKDLRLMI